MKELETKQDGRAVQIWLWIGLAMIFFQVSLGGITRLTGSGLSITKWDIVTGALPPMNEQTWQMEFDLYRQTPQYHKINQGMSLADFKFIYFWEYLHRLWARSMGFVFLFPFLFFWSKKMISPSLRKHLGWVVALAALVAAFGWIMVASGLVNRPWVNAYKLSIHLGLAFLLYAYLLWATLHAMFPNKATLDVPQLRKWSWWITALLAVQVIVGGWMSGMKAGIYYPTFPDMNGELVPSILFDAKEWKWESLERYDETRFVPALVQLMHRSLAYLISFCVLVYYFKAKKFALPTVTKQAIFYLFVMLLAQVTLGIITVLNCLGTIPLWWGVLHQAGALMLLSFALYNNFQYIKKG